MNANSPRLLHPRPDGLLPAECRFNPSLLRWGKRLWMVYRRVDTDPRAPVESWQRRLALCALDEDLQPVAGSNIDLSARIIDPPSARRWHADARFFVRPDGPWLWYHDNHAMFAFPIDPERVPERLLPVPLVLHGYPRQERERNWGVFDDGDWKAVYTIRPHRVLRLRESANEIISTPLHETLVDIPWDSVRWGEPHGGSSPVRVGPYWFSFFQSAAPSAAGSAQKIYRVGFYGFEADPPHRMRFMSSRPLIDGSAIAGQLSYWNDYAVAYPSGAVFEDGRWLVSLGIHDRAIAFARFEHAELLAACARL